MSKNSIQIIARGTRSDVDTASEIFEADYRLEALGFSILAENEELNVWRIDAFPNTEEEAEVLAEHLKTIRTLTIKKVRLADADWLAMSLSGLPPVLEGRFVLYGEHDSSRVPINAISLEIDAGAAFGTGHHGTTAGCLSAFDQLLKRRRFARVLDVGSGTGVLAIAAARTGSRSVLGVDIDAVSVRISRENARLNRARARFVHASGLDDPTVRAGRPYDLVFANILARPLVWLAQDIRSALKPGGVAILSGLLRTQERQVKAAYLARGFALEQRIPRDAWQTLILRKR
ncbi:MAG TPA: 50S ribosomal protein L11 methyltransferase [Caulobacteraceae bacterium]|jgi:ribosomal protein L11 methyltransferase|nr:50S ribosomal protein L11 methyltransferase [Caulobacteraceae bacterium]